MTCQVPTKRCLFKLSIKNNSTKFLTSSKLYASFDFTTIKADPHYAAVTRSLSIPSIN